MFNTFIIKNAKIVSFFNINTEKLEFYDHFGGRLDFSFPNPNVS